MKLFKRIWSVPCSTSNEGILCVGVVCVSEFQSPMARDFFANNKQAGKKTKKGEDEKKDMISK